MTQQMCDGANRKTNVNILEKKRRVERISIETRLKVEDCVILTKYDLDVAFPDVMICFEDQSLE